MDHIASVIPDVHFFEFVNNVTMVSILKKLKVSTVEFAVENGMFANSNIFFTSVAFPIANNPRNLNALTQDVFGYEATPTTLTQQVVMAVCSWCDRPQPHQITSAFMENPISNGTRDLLVSENVRINIQVSGAAPVRQTALMPQGLAGDLRNQLRNIPSTMYICEVSISEC